MPRHLAGRKRRRAPALYIGVTVYGQGRYTYEIAGGWGTLPSGYKFDEASGVDVDQNDDVYVFNRSSHQMQVFDREGSFLRAWPDTWSNPHGIHIDDGHFYLVDRDSHVVMKYGPDETLLLELGTRGQPSDTGYTEDDPIVKTAAGPFNRPAGRVAINGAGDIFVADGYGNARIHRFSADGSLLSSLGAPGSGPGEFLLVHGVALDGEGRLLVCDFGNDRIQIFDQEGQYLTSWSGLRGPTEVVIGSDDEVYVAEYRHRLSVLDGNGKVLARLGDESSHRPGQFVAPHGLAVDSHGDIYVAEVVEDSCPDCAGSCYARRLQKFIRQH